MTLDFEGSFAWPMLRGYCITQLTRFYNHSMKLFRADQVNVERFECLMMFMFTQQDTCW